MEEILKIEDITKDYIGVRALDNVSFNVKKGEIHALCGENGAGKSTLIKAISGAIKLTSGKITFEGKDLDDKSPKDRIGIGISVIYQELNLFPNLTIYENVYFGIEPKKNGILDRPKMIRDTEEVLKNLGVKVDVRKKVREVPIAYQQMVEIAKSLVKNVKLLIMDEPSSSLTEHEVRIMLNITKELNRNGLTIIYISHKLDEVLEIADRVTILRDGKYIKTIENEEITKDEIITSMVGRKLSNIYPDKRNQKGEKLFSFENISGGIVKNVSFDVYKGEVLGFGGLVGAGRTELMKMIFGADKMEKGQIRLKNDYIKIKSISQAVSKGIGLVPENRASEGIILNKSIYFNNLLPNLKDYESNKLGFIERKSSKADIERVNKSLNTKMVDMHQNVSTLSGGNQQKVVLAKWLLNNCEMLILDEPTRGIDVGAKKEIYDVIDELARSGKAIIVVSSEMPELIGISDRIIVMSEGEISGEIKDLNEMNEENIMKLASLGEGAINEN
ncbi:sugar ABC transporter ATP-binding protein [Helcococcus kunzii]|uniref:sugar ABC transporter ATP-binding protein n=1 Tax=Helcococcus kunzii TaxID=40091 RepID=UPI0021A3C008|nr:sugar ABC transporter ATP-binding protein [Helcococcus kunzii]MCT1796364.1 sugar ABC transporter ATP-binding protein [Helcococcus kunzii]MCT1989414.1 sugar ABC transporter ATP-binding protein [Helcococcus kunzii]